MQHKQDKPIFAVNKFLRRHHPKYLTTKLSRLPYPWLLGGGVSEWETNKTLYHTKDEPKAWITAAFIKATVEKA